MRVIIYNVDAADRNEIESVGEITYLPDVGDFILLNDQCYEVRRRLFRSGEEVWIDAKHYTEINGKFSFSSILLS
ncbi:hypothetical protein FHW19_004177 [Ochrobactrum anthropi]|uniref:hypothetical protein n=1 Tax=Brucella anthropi TaxID=529 RepID=UPI0015F7B2C7|nr:hypothetical protein [Brucella anthropi]MBA8862431.1 hypothetical protein [Brucella anthropi]